LNSPPPSFSFIPLIPGIVSGGIIVLLSYMCTQYLYHVHLPWPFPTSFFPLPLVPTPTLDLFTILFSDFVEEKKMTFFA
jgi:hypothetical protein